ncbi:hypothetical protein LCGC14_2078270 [marine sediment metagenome]|uniref:Uncharacterized protein n=1 Tax=marine sediment metagenome TaxID=412755 RepID=A0A0F9HD97_9ZZZZ
MTQQFTIAELGAKFGGQMGQVLSELIVLEKLVEAQQAQIQELIENKTSLENELAQSKSEIYNLQHELQKNRTALSSEAAEITEQAREIIANEKEKAASTEAA